MISGRQYYEIPPAGQAITTSYKGNRRFDPDYGLNYGHHSYAIEQKGYRAARAVSGSGLGPAGARQSLSALDDKRANEIRHGVYAHVFLDVKNSSKSEAPCSFWFIPFSHFYITLAIFFDCFFHFGTVLLLPTLRTAMTPRPTAREWESRRSTGESAERGQPHASFIIDSEPFFPTLDTAGTLLARPADTDRHSAYGLLQEIPAQLNKPLPTMPSSSSGWFVLKITSPRDPPAQAGRGGDRVACHF
ncbi:hypothetical protein CSIM01_09807 [Colletotrichum simmondsii]|uniref:Uncharacterized protein n=1 Tax=Colletotrichum simmondsii TaxID=703756 RepID=A0A135SPM4_9PEZI|nr:hypothetical protein CSIM01_09807 [Colletotrichum simmondsii]